MRSSVQIGLETYEEANHSLNLLSQYLQENQDQHEGVLDDATRDILKDFQKDHFHSVRRHLYHHFFIWRMTLGNYNSSVVEAENRVLKHHCQGVAPYMGIDEGFTAVNGVSDKRRRRHKRKEVAAFVGTETRPEDRAKVVRELVDHCNKLLQRECDLSENYVCTS